MRMRGPVALAEHFLRSRLGQVDAFLTNGRVPNRDALLMDVKDSPHAVQPRQTQEKAKGVRTWDLSRDFWSNHSLGALLKTGNCQINNHPVVELDRATAGYRHEKAAMVDLRQRPQGQTQLPDKAGVDDVQVRTLICMGEFPWYNQLPRGRVLPDEHFYCKGLAVASKEFHHRLSHLLGSTSKLRAVRCPREHCVRSGL